ncbi:MAG: T9SS type A sorting domain-containing protein [Bacteroidales bacterium]|nr:T9SS type A sorting domain-containing protein [Bacteroidales bacterium]
MKRTSFIAAVIVLLLCADVARGQETPASQNKQWHIVEYEFGHYTCFDISTGLDTTINESLATQLYKNEIYVGAYFTNGDKCYFVDSLGNTTLLYDYGLQPGDTAFWIPIEETLGEEELYLVVDSISTIQINGEVKKVLFFKPISDAVFKYIRECWIEDVGSVHGFLYPARFHLLEVEAQQKCDLTCFFQDNNLVWMNPNYTECGVSSVTEYGKEVVLLYPNPASKVLNVVLPEKVILEKIYCDIFDIQGNLVKKEVIPSGTQKQIDISILSAGQYLIRCYDASKFNQSVKFIKQ